MNSVGEGKWGRLFYKQGIPQPQTLLIRPWDSPPKPTFGIN